jgi:hypothetical protein
LPIGAAFVSLTVSRSGQGSEPGTLLGKDNPFVPEAGIDTLFPAKPSQLYVLKGLYALNAAFERSLSGSHVARTGIDGDGS